MLKRLQSLSELILRIKRFTSKYDEIWDVVLYGSYVRGKEHARDIDFAIIIPSKVSVGKKLIIAQELKENIESIAPTLQLDVKVVDIDDFFDLNFLAKQAIIAEGYLILRKKYISDLFGFKTFALVNYSLEGLTYSQKKMLYYALRGRRGSKGVLEGIKGELISRELLKIPIQAYYEIEELLKLHKVKFKTEFIISYGRR